ncbi:MAG TPA: transglycosylase domain-containing protein [Lysobacter sp.]
MDAWPKWILSTALTLVALLVALCFGVYWYGASALPAVLEPSAYVAPASIREQFRLVEAGNATRLPKLNPVTVWYHLHRSMGSDATSRSELTALGQASRVVSIRDTPRLANLRRHAADLARMIRISRNWSFQQVLDTRLAESWFGRDSKGLEAAAHAYFGFAPTQLTPEESLALIVLMRGPSAYDPTCHRERFVERYVRVAPLAGIDPVPEAAERALVRLRDPQCRR